MGEVIKSKQKPRLTYCPYNGGDSFRNLRPKRDNQRNQRFLQAIYVKENYKSEEVDAYAAQLDASTTQGLPSPNKNEEHAMIVNFSQRECKTLLLPWKEDFVLTDELNH